VPNDYVLSFEIACYIKTFTTAKMIIFFTDDSFYYKQRTDVIDAIRRKWLLKCGREVVRQSEGLITASSLMQKEYKNLFNKDSVVLGNSVEISEADVPLSNESNIFIISYVGNLHSNRWKNLLDLGEALEKINSGRDVKTEIHVYTASDLGAVTKSKLNTYSAIKLKGALIPSQVRNVQEKSDAFLHIEAFDHKSKLSTRLSMSTKIFEYMARHRPIFAYGPSDIASIDFLKEGSFATICASKSDLYSSLDLFLRNKNLRRKQCDLAYEYAVNNFKSENKSSLVYEFIHRIIY